MRDLDEHEQLAAVMADAPWVAYAFRRRADGSYSVPFASAGIERLFDLDRESIRHDAMLLFARIVPEHVTRVRDGIERSAASLVPWHEEFQIRRRDGSIVWIEGRSVPEREPDGSVLWKGMCHDVSERRRLDARLRETQELLRLMVSQAPARIAVLDHELRYVATTTRWLHELGDGRSDLAGLEHDEVHPDLPERWKRVHRDALAGISTSADEELWVQGDGTHTWHRWSVHPLRNADGTVGGIIIFSEDITARKASEEAIRASEQRYRDLVELVPDAILLLRDGRIVLANPAALTLAGAASLDALRDIDPLTLVHPDSLETARARLGQTVAGDTTPWTLLRTRGLDGREREIESAGYPFVDREGPAVQIVARDVTDRNRAERAFREGEARLSAIIRAAMDGIVTVDEDQRILLANPAAEAMFEAAPGALVGEPLERLIPTRDRAGHAERVLAFGRAGPTHRAMGIVTGVRASGEEFPIEASISQVQVGDRRLFTVIARDIGPRLATERALQAQEAQFRQLAESIREVFWLTDVDKREIVYISPAYETIWGRSRASVISDPRSWLEAIHPDDRERVTQAALERQISGEYDEEYRVVRPDGRVRWVHDRAFPVRDESGRVVRIAGVAEDVTERRGLEAQLRQTQKMESIGRLAGGVAHDFNNLLTVIVSSADLLRDEVAAGSAGDELVQEILDAGRRGATLTRQLLAFTRQEVVEPRVMDLADVVTDAEKLLRRLLGEDVVLLTHLDSAAAPVRVDLGQWTQVLLNLAVNARDAMPSGGRLEVETRALVADETFAREHPGVRPGPYAVLTVRDSGTGMSADVRSRIFEPFFTTKPPGQGTGLGLAVVYGVVHQAGGHVEVESALGTGTTFTIYVPATRTAEAAKGDASAPESARGDEVVLLVEDEGPVRRVAARILASKGYRVLVAEDGAHALALLDAHSGPLDLVVTDVVMPNLDGPSLAQQIRARYPRVEVLYASGYIGDSLSARGVIAQGSTFLQKPYTPAMLLQRVRELLDTRDASSPRV